MFPNLREHLAWKLDCETGLVYGKVVDMLAENAGQRDELLAAAKIAVETFDDDAPGPGVSEKEALRRLRAAIARARSGEGQAGEGQED